MAEVDRLCVKVNTRTYDDVEEEEEEEREEDKKKKGTSSGGMIESFWNTDKTHRTRQGIMDDIG